MSKRRKKIISIGLVASLLVSMGNTVYAAGQNEILDPLPNQGKTEITLEVKDGTGGGGTTDPDVPGGGGTTDPDNPAPEIIIATIPVELPIVMDLNGEVAVPTDAKIINHVEDKGIKVTNIDIELSNGWAVASYSEDFSAKEADTQEIGMKLRDDELGIDNTFVLTEDNWKIPKSSYIDLGMQAKIPKQTTAGDKGKIATLGFTLDWSGDNETTGPSIPNIPDVPPDIPENPDKPDINPPTEGKFTVTYTTDGNGQVSGEQTKEFIEGDTITFPAILPNEGYIFDKWVDTDGNEVTTSTTISSNTTLKALFKANISKQATISFTTDGNGILEGETTIVAKVGDPIPFPTPVPNNISVEFKEWVDASNNKLENNAKVTGDTVITAKFPTRAASPANWFVGTNGTITGLSDEYLNMVDAPTDLVIPRALGGSSVKAIGANALAEKDLITSVVIPNTVTTISENAFKNCAGLTGIYIPEGVTTIGASAFNGCTGICTIKLPASLTNCNSSFSGWDSTKTIILDDDANLTSSSEDMLNSCSAKFIYNGIGYKPVITKEFKTTKESNWKLDITGQYEEVRHILDGIEVAIHPDKSQDDYIFLPTIRKQTPTSEGVLVATWDIRYSDFSNKDIYACGISSVFRTESGFNHQGLRNAKSIIVDDRHPYIKSPDAKQLIQGGVLLTITEGSLLNNCEFTLDESVSAINSNAFKGTKIGTLNIPKASTEITGMPWGAPNTCEIRFSDGFIFNSREEIAPAGDWDINPVNLATANSKYGMDIKTTGEVYLVKDSKGLQGFTGSETVTLPTSINGVRVTKYPKLDIDNQNLNVKMPGNGIIYDATFSESKINSIEIISSDFLNPYSKFGLFERSTLKSIIIPDKINNSSNTFSNCTNLVDIDASKINLTSYVFNNCTSLEVDLDLEGGGKQIYGTVHLVI